MRETKYWVIVASRDHVLTGVKGGFAQACHGKGAPLKRMQSGDFILYYSSKEKFSEPTPYQKFTACGKVSSSLVYQFEMSEDFCPFRIDIEYLPVKEVEIKPLIPSLDFITNKSRWGYNFRYGFFEISEKDFSCIYSLMKV